MTRTTFTIATKDDLFNKGDIITTSSNKFKCIKTYRKTWWKLLLKFVGFNIIMNNEVCIIKVKPIK